MALIASSMLPMFFLILPISANATPTCFDVNSPPTLACALVPCVSAPNCSDAIIASALAWPVKFSPVADTTLVVPSFITMIVVPFGVTLLD